MKFILFGRSRSGTTITYRILKEYEGLFIQNQKNDFLKNGFEGGNKMATPSTDLVKKLVDRGFKFIHIYRDGRDSVTSGMRMSKIWPEYRRWKDLDPKINSKDWADAIWSWEKSKKFVNPNSRLELRFEDYIEYPEKNSGLISDFLELNKEMLVKIEAKLINPKNAHMGYYKDRLSDWEETFHPDAIKALKFLGYIKEAK